MNELLKFYSSSIGKKILMGLTGLFLVSFLCVHLYINLFLFCRDNGGTFETYAEFMATYPLVRPIEIGLFLGFLLHGFLGVILWLKNRSVRPIGYQVDRTGARSTWVSRLTILTGFVVLIFLVYHIRVFFVTSRFMNDDIPMFDRVAEAFSRPGVVVFYLVALLFLGLHLKHGFQSVFQTFGLRVPRYQKMVDGFAFLIWFLIPALFAAIPVYLLIIRRGWLP